MSELYKHDTYLNKNIPYLFNYDITEYDLKDAGYSISKEYKLLSNEKLDYLKSLPKKKRTVQLGLYQREDSIFKENLKIGFRKARQIFFESNNILERELLSIKKDAIFLNRLCNNREFGYLNFRPKNTYTSYLYLKTDNGGTLELYYNKDKIDVKGISESKIELHENYMMKFLNTFFQKMESNTPKEVLQWLCRFISKYKRRDLETGYYRTFNNRSIIELLDNDVVDFIYEEDKSDNIEIGYNYFNILMKLVKMPL